MRRTHSRHGFTLIEIMAVVLIMGLAFGLFLPNLDAARGRQLENRAREVAQRLQIARERAIMTGAAHRVWFDVENGTMRVDWFVTEDRAVGANGSRSFASSASPDPAVDSRGRRKVSLRPPKTAERDYFPIPNQFGTLTRLPPDYFFVGIDTLEGFIDRGEVQLVFGRDGTTDYAEIVLADAWENQVVLEVQPLLDVVRIRVDDEGNSRR